MVEGEESMKTAMVGWLVSLLVLSGLRLPSLAGTAYTWTPTAGGTAYNWDNAGPQNNWGTGVGGSFPNAVDDVANLNNNVAGAQTISLNQAITLGTLNLGDSTSSFYAFIITNGTAGSLTFDVGSGSAQINKTTIANSAPDAIGVAITLNDNLIVNNAATNGALTISGAIGGNYTVTKTGVGTNTLTGSNTFSSLTIKQGTVMGGGIGVPSSTAFGAAGSTITLGDNGGSADATLYFQYNTNKTYNYAISVASGNTGKATIQYTTGAGPMTVSGGVTLNNHDVYFANGITGGDKYTFGAVGGTGDVHVALNNGSAPGLVLSGGLNITGRLINESTAAGSIAAKVSVTVGAITNTVTAIIQNSGTIPLDLDSYSPNYTNGVWVKNGRLIANRGGGSNVVFGTGTVTLGDDTVANTNAVSLGSSSSPTVNNNITLADRGTFTGVITIGSADGSVLTCGGTITGTNDIILANLIGQPGGTTFSASSSINNSGTVTHTDTNSGVVAISGTIGANVTQLTQNSSTAKMTLSANNPFAGTALVSAGTLELNHTNALRNATLNTGASGTQQVAFVVSGTKTYNLGGLAGANNLTNAANNLSIQSHVAPGYGGVGTLVVTGTGSVTLGSGIILDVEYGGGQVDKLTVDSGTLALPATATVGVSGTGARPTSAVILSAGTLTGDVTGWTVSSGFRVLKVGNTVVLSRSSGTVLTVQ